MDNIFKELYEKRMIEKKSTKDGYRGFVGNFDYASLYPTTMRDFSEEIRIEALKKKRNDKIDDLLNE